MSDTRAYCAHREGICNKFYFLELSGYKKFAYKKCEKYFQELQNLHIEIYFMWANFFLTYHSLISKPSQSRAYEKQNVYVTF